MPTYNVHIYREMRLVFGGIEADTQEAAAAIARDKPTEEADSIDDCDGETFYACVDVQGDEEYEQSRWIDFEPERLRRAAPALLAELTGISQIWSNAEGGSEVMDYLESRIYHIRAAIAEAESAGKEPL